MTIENGLPGTTDIPVEGADASQETEQETPEVETEDQVDGEESESEEESPPSDDEPVDKPPKGVQKRFDELTRNLRESERREQRLLDMLAARESAEKPSAPAEPDKTLADFNYDEVAYRGYVTQSAIAAAREAARETVTEAQKAELAEARAATFKAREDRFAINQADYVEVTRNPDLKINATMSQVIREADEGPALAYHLGKNPEVAAKISGMSALSAARELGKIEATLAASRKAAAKTVSDAPPPTPTIPGASASVQKDPNKMTTKEWVKWRERQIAKKG